MITGIVLAFTGRLLPYAVTTQSGGTCVAHGVANIATLMGYDLTAQDVIETVNVSYLTGYNTRNLPRTMTGYNIGSPRKLQKVEVIHYLKIAPMIATVLDPISTEYGELKEHTFTALGTHTSGVMIANSRGTGRGVQGYAVIPRDELDDVWFQSIGYNPVTGSSYQSVSRKLTRSERFGIAKQRYQERKKEQEKIKLQTQSKYKSWD